ncbi:hypothetical protein SARC_09690 [Sphaeroforma arctica JP610]|uniref:Uncharacterized protein n=1 Tax=Sphaeroforma arctica JP610 TaxID=667725 RepID=A0A0L0FM46_9EUKA|nr:hypothetical protein SARC_09690 [Sphaeroforma arctica JP610]KNC77859.1 hypothetical protein SARC_09690 [Sphaeroforma arctica JP610]|eukprot:XP_014151761.1 hypothetical protein SARC_09690 [Sphaeroforma arctica JP610]
MIIVTIDKRNNTIISLSDRNRTLGYSARSLREFNGKEFCSLLVARDIGVDDTLYKRRNVSPESNSCDRCKLDSHEYLIKSHRSKLVPVTLWACLPAKHSNRENTHVEGLATTGIQTARSLNTYRTPSDTQLYNELDTDNTDSDSNELVLVLSEARDFDGFDKVFRGGHFDSEHVAVVQISDVGRIMSVPRGSSAVFGHNIRACDLLCESFLRFVRNDDIPLFLRKMRECADYGVSVFTLNLISEIKAGDDPVDWSMEVFAQKGSDGRVYMLMVKSEDMIGMSDVENILHDMSYGVDVVGEDTFFSDLSHGVSKLLGAAANFGYHTLQIVVQIISVLNNIRMSVGAGVVNVIEGAVNIYFNVGGKVTNALLYPYVKFFGIVNSGVSYAVGAADVSLVQVGEW